MRERSIQQRRTQRKHPNSVGNPSASAQPRLLLQALEPRVLLDAAAVQTAQEVTSAAPAAEPAPDAGDHVELMAALGSMEQPGRAQSGPPAERVEVYFIDRGVPQADELASGLPSGAEVHFIDEGVDGVQFMAATLQGRGQVDAVHVFSHGQAGQLQLGTAELSSQAMQGAYREALGAIGQALGADADILIYGCDFAAGESGEQAARLLAELTGADVAASTDLTGASELGGDWTLEASVGTVDAQARALSRYAGLLADPATIPDTDGDGVIDSADIDDDNDGILDGRDGYDTSAVVPLPTAAIATNTIAPLDYNGVTVNTTVSGTGDVSYGDSEGEVWFNFTASVPIPQVTLGFDQQVDFQLSSKDGPSGKQFNLRDTMTISSAGHLIVVSDPDDVLTIGSGIYTGPITFSANGTADSYDANWTITVLATDTVTMSARNNHEPSATTNTAAAVKFSVVGVALDSDDDGTLNHADLDSDNDGIGDNVEAQATSSYRAPSGQGAAMVDADNDGLDDRYDSDTADGSAAASVGLSPLNTDGDGTVYANSDSTPDFLDGDSDGDAKPDVAERGDDQPDSVTDTADTDGDGLLDIFEHGSASDGYYVHDGLVTTAGSDPMATTVESFDLLDTDADVADDGSNAAPGRDFDWRDPLNAPRIDLNSTVGASDGSTGYSTSYTGGNAAVQVAAPVADVADSNENDLSQMSITLAGIADGANEIVRIGGADFALNAASTQTVTVDSIQFLVSYTLAGGFLVTRSGGGLLPQGSLDLLVRGISYRNTLGLATAGARTLSFVVGDNTGRSSLAAVSTIQVSPSAAPVITVPGDQRVDEDRNLAITGVSVADADGDPLTVTVSVANGTLAVAPGGGAVITNNDSASVTLVGTAAQINLALAGLSFTPTADYNGPSTLTLMASDAYQSRMATVSIAVDAVKDIADDSVTTDEDTVRPNIDVLLNDSFENAGRSITAINGTSIQAGGSVPVANGTVMLQLDGKLTFAPLPNFNGATSFTYTVSSGGVTETATVGVVVVAVNDAPANTVPGAQQTDEDQELAIGGMSVADTEGGILTATVSVTGGTLRVGTAGGAFIANNASDSVMLTGTAAQINAALAGLSFMPTPDYNGAATLTLLTRDGPDGASSTRSDSDAVAIAVTAVQDIQDDAATTDEDTARADIDVLLNDSFENAGRSVTSIDGTPVAANGAVAVANGTVTLQPDGKLSFSPAANFNGTTSFTYTVASGGVFETATVSMTVVAVNDAPVNTLPAAQQAQEDQMLTITGVSVADAEDGNLSATISVTHGMLSVATGGGASVSDNGSASVTLTGSAAQINAALAGLAYTPTADYNGPALLTLTTRESTAAADGSTPASTGTLPITVLPVVDIAPDAASLPEDHAINLEVLLNDSFENADRAITAINGAPLGVGMPVAVSNGWVTLWADGTLDFTPDANFSGPVSFSYTVTSGGVSETADVTLDVLPVNDVPVLVDAGVPGQPFDAATGTYSAWTQEDIPFNGRVAAADADGDALSYTLSAMPTHGSVSVDAATGAYVYTPGADYNGSDSFVVTISDGHGGTLETTVKLTVAPVVDIADDTVVTTEDLAVNIAVGSNDRFASVGATVTGIDGQAVTPGVPVAVSHGTVVVRADGTLDFTPAAGFLGATSFSYTVTSGGLTETAAVSVHVDNAPVIDFPFVYLPEDEPAEPLPLPEPPYPRDRHEVRDAVNQAGPLGATADLPVNGPVLAAVNGVASLDGTRALGVVGPVMAAVNGVDSLRGHDTPAQEHQGDTARVSEAPPAFSASLGLAGDLQLELVGNHQQIFVVATHGAAKVHEIRATLADGGALPAWARVHPRGFLVLEPPPDAELLRLRLTVVDGSGDARSVGVEIDLGAGQMREIGRTPGSEERQRNPAWQKGATVVPDFSMQLARAVHVGNPQDASLLAVLD